MPPSLPVESCQKSAPRDELPNARFLRKGGRILRPIKTWQQGTALTVDDIAQGRDLSRYDKLDLSDLEPAGRHQKTLAQARSFMWSHWQARKKAYLVLTLSSVDAIGTSHVFIEPDDLGRWRVYWRTVHRGEVDDSPTAYTMQWVIPGGQDEPGSPLTDKQSPDPLRDELEFADACDEVQDSF